MSVGVSAGVNAANVANAAHLHLVAVGVATVNAPVALAGVAVTGKVVVRKETAEMSAGGEAGPPLPETPGGACPPTGGGMREPEPHLWMMA